MPYTAGRYQKRSFQKVNCPVIERLTNSLMFKGRSNGKKQLAMRIVKQTLELIHLMTGENPLQIVTDALSNGGCREDSTRIGSGGTVRRQAVDVSPLRRVNQAMYFICKGVRESAMRSLKSISELLADEIIACAKVTHFSCLTVYRDPDLEATAMQLRRRTKSKELPRVTDDLPLNTIVLKSLL